MPTPKTGKLFQQVYDSLGLYITENDLQPGDLLPTEQALCQQLGASRNVVREAIKSMELMGLVRGVPGRGTEILPFNMDFMFKNALMSNVRINQNALSEMVIIRKQLELGFMGEAYDMLTAADVEAVRRIFEGMREIGDRPSDQFLPLDQAFHMALFMPIKNQSLQAILEAIWLVDRAARPHERTQFWKNDLRMHENIVLGLENGNKEAFEAAMRLHYSAISFAVKSAAAE